MDIDDSIFSLEHSTFFLMGVTAFIYQPHFCSDSKGKNEVDVPNVVDESRLSHPILDNLIFFNHLSGFDIFNPVATHPLWCFYQKAFTDWFSRYMEDSHHEEEKKYKLIFISMWMKYGCACKTYPMYDILDRSKLEEICHEIRNTTQYDIIQLFSSSQCDDFYYYELFEEDSHSSFKKQIAQQVFRDFERFGLIGKHFMHSRSPDVLCLIALQQYQLGPQDLKEIEKITHQNYQIPMPFRHSLFFSELSYHYCQKIIETNSQHLAILRKFFMTMKDNSKISHIIDLIDRVAVANHIASTLEHALDIKPLEKTQKI